MTVNEKVLLFGILGVAGVAVYSLTRKSEDAAPATGGPKVLPPPPPVVTPVAPAVKPFVTLPPLDVGLSNAEVLAIQNALSHETLAANLTGFASTFEPMFPVAARLLRAKAASLGSGGVMTGKEEPCCAECEEGAKHGKPPCTPKVTGSPIVRGLPSLFGVEIQ
jgi:hypothetical protein